MKIAVDAMGGDRAPEVVLEGCAQALRDFPQIDQLLLVGDEAVLKPLWDKAGADSSRCEIVHAASVVDMHEPATAPLRQKKDSSITVAADLVKEARAEALVSAGHTGAAVAVTTVKWRLLPGIERPGICTSLPAAHGHTHILDAGANVDAKVDHLVAYGIMGTSYCRRVLGIDDPKVGLISVGEEDHKGTDFTREVFAKLKEAPLNFVGNVEGRDLFESGIDVIVCDGFTGNVMLKTAEATATALFNWLREELTATPVRKLGTLMAKNGFRAIKKRMSYDQVGGSPLLGVNGICIIAHGSSNATAIRNAIRVAAEAVDHDLNAGIQRRMGELS